jgi:hypothetical protein
MTQSFSSFTRNIAFGSNSKTIPSNSINSSFGILSKILITANVRLYDNARLSATKRICFSSIELAQVSLKDALKNPERQMGYVY